MRIILLAFLLIFMLPFSVALAACTGPVGVEGAIIYNEDQNVPQICTNTGWIGLGIINPAAGGAGCTGPVGVEGAMIYNDDFHKPQYCDGDIWVEMIGTAAATGGLTGPTGCANIGDQCADLTIFDGWNQVTSNQLFIHPNNQSTDSLWSSESVVTGATSISDGKANHDWIVANKTISNYPAFKDCDDLNIASALGHTDWYLPSRVELYYLWTHQTTINAGPSDAFIVTHYWPSMESSSGGAWYHNFSTGGQDSINKAFGKDVRCMRRGS